MTERIIDALGAEREQEQIVINPDLQRFIISGGLIDAEVLRPLVGDVDEFDRQLLAIEADILETKPEDVFGSRYRIRQMADLRERFVAKARDDD